MYRYKVLRFPEKTIQNDRSQTMTLILDAFYKVKRNNKKIEMPQLAESYDRLKEEKNSLEAELSSKKS